MYQAVLCRYGEIGLKGENRGFFEKILLENIRQALKPTSGVNVQRLSGRLLITYHSQLDEILLRLSNVLGLVSVSPVLVVEPDLESIAHAAEQLMASHRQAKTLAVRCRRSDKRFPLNSPQLGAWLGSRLLETRPDLKVDLDTPDLRIEVEVRNTLALVYDSIYPGPGGLPVSCSGRGLLLLSGGLDSPVAGWMAMKRGIQISAVYFHSFPYTGDHAQQKVIDLGKKLAVYNRGALHLTVVDIAPVQEAIVKHCPEKLRVTLLRRMMLRLAEKIAATEATKVLITGDSVGQVASQTLESMSVISQAISMLQLRPLCGMDKTEIVSLARKIGTYDTSVLPYPDCCSLFVPRHPATRPDERSTISAEGLVEWGPLLEEAFNSRELVSLTSLAAPVWEV